MKSANTERPDIIPSFHHSVPLPFTTPRLHHSTTPIRAPHYALRKGFGFWELTFDGQSAVFKHEQGAFYVAYLLANPPPEPIHGLALALKIRAIRGTAAGES